MWCLLYAVYVTRCYSLWRGYSLNSCCKTIVRWAQQESAIRYLESDNPGVNTECGGQSSSPVYSHADLPLNCAKQVSKVVFTLSINISLANSELVSEESSRGFVLNCIIVVAALISRAFFFLWTVNAILALAHICALYANAVTRTHDCPTAL